MKINTIKSYTIDLNDNEIPSITFKYGETPKSSKGYKMQTLKWKHKYFTSH